MVLILGLLAIARLNQRTGAAKLLAGLSCKWIHSQFEGTPFECYYEAVRKLLKSLLKAGLAEFCKGKYILADSVDFSLRELASQVPTDRTRMSGQESSKVTPTSPDSAESSEGQSLPTTFPVNAPGAPTRNIETTDDETNKKAVGYLVALVASNCFVPSLSTYWQIASCRTSSLAKLACAASGLATAIMNDQKVYSPAVELQAVLDGSSTIKPTSAKSFVFAFEAYEREIVSEATLRRNAEVAELFAPITIKFYELLTKRFTSMQDEPAVPETVVAADAAAVAPMNEERPLGKIHRLYVYGDFGNAS
jgi:hypothetical protein